ncbi:cysteine--tRNA ligase, cytoplasmic isoform X3 [Hydra vulgaris]|uniref:cysteine--tRNA ligase, cytoplasmic isoform X3 n=2 Tax=Hydra vulgaris TaxID=6087 RepID=UPI001F5E458D|nr:cysteine--tRNA ligase, cytoplasmic isoform X2 [Hydra vulgaris]
MFFKNNAILYIFKYSTQRISFINIRMQHWTQPCLDSQTNKSQLHLYNSLTRETNLFVPQSGNKVTWYSCGPTVYDASHMGHARSYITFDILRRVMSDYFNYDIFYVMNITDVDDKIINRARRNHLMKQFRESNPSNEKVLEDLDISLKNYREKLLKTTDADKRVMINKILESVVSCEDQFKKAISSGASIADIDHLKEDLLLKSHDPLSEWLDAQFGSTITEHRIFSELTQYWEKEYNDDMKSLNIRPADIITRVSQYIPEIVAYIERIIENGFGYVCNGSVYFDTIKFGSSENHKYAKLVPEAVGDLAALAEGEGDLSQLNPGAKKSDRDFALWKASKVGEPYWPSPWGNGRPGWHIECSAMASDILGNSIDIHTGGVDLKFPHHDNEIAQAEAHYNCTQWINYFLHAGHLTIEGCKMSKSLKNFVTVKDALKKNTSRQIRLAFLLHAWNATLDYSSNVLKEAEQIEKLFMDFFLNVKDIIRNNESFSLTSHNYKEEEKLLQNNFMEKKQKIHEALCDSINTVVAVQQMQSLVKLANIYIGQARQNNKVPNHAVIGGIAKYLTKMLKIFGANDGDQEIGFSSVDVSGNLKHEEIVMPYIQLVAEFRESVRKVAREKKVPEILKMCDEIRDTKLPELGVQLEDHEGNNLPVVKLVDKETLLKERQQKLDEIEKKRREKEELKQKQLEEKLMKEAKAKVPPSEMFKLEQDKYSLFDEQGIPTHDSNGEKLSSSQLKKLKKLYTQQEKLYQKHLES